MKISWTEHRSNQEVLDMVDENRKLMNIIRQRQKSKVMCWEVNTFCVLYSLRRNGRDKNSWETECYDDGWTKSNDMEYGHIKERAYDREDWRHWRPEPGWKSRAHKREIKTCSKCVMIKRFLLILKICNLFFNKSAFPCWWTKFRLLSCLQTACITIEDISGILTKRVCRMLIVCLSYELLTMSW